MENKEVDYITFKTYEAAMNQIISWAENCKRTIGDFAGVLIALLSLDIRFFLWMHLNLECLDLPQKSHLS